MNFAFLKALSFTILKTLYFEGAHCSFDRAAHRVDHAAELDEAAATAVA